jgi:hypothetical protein
LLLGVPRDDKVAGSFLLECSIAILVPRPPGEKVVWLAVTKMPRKVPEKSMNVTIAAF